MAKRAKITIISLLFLLTITCFFLGRAIWYNMIWKLHVDSLVASSAYNDARKNYVRGRKILYEIKVSNDDASYEGKVYLNDETEFSGRRESGYEIWYFFQTSIFGAPNRYVQAEYVKDYNKHIKFIYDHPDQFDSCGLRLPKGGSASQ